MSQSSITKQAGCTQNEQIDEIWLLTTLMQKEIYNHLTEICRKFCSRYEVKRIKIYINTYNYNNDQLSALHNKILKFANDDDIKINIIIIIIENNGKCQCLVKNT